MDIGAHPLLSLMQDDPPPFSAAYPKLQRLDRSLICGICKECFTGPVTVTCGHSFCSQVSTAQSLIQERRLMRTVHQIIA